MSLLGALFGSSSSSSTSSSSEVNAVDNRTAGSDQARTAGMIRDANVQQDFSTYSLDKSVTTLNVLDGGAIDAAERVSRDAIAAGVSGQLVTGAVADRAIQAAGQTNRVVAGFAGDIAKASLDTSYRLATDTTAKIIGANAASLDFASLQSGRALDFAGVQSGRALDFASVQSGRALDFARTSQASADAARSEALAAMQASSQSALGYIERASVDADERQFDKLARWGALVALVAVGGVVAARVVR